MSPKKKCSKKDNNNPDASYSCKKCGQKSDKKKHLCKPQKNDKN